MSDSLPLPVAFWIETALLAASALALLLVVVAIKRAQRRAMTTGDMTTREVTADPGTRANGLGLTGWRLPRTGAGAATGRADEERAMIIRRHSFAGALFLAGVLLAPAAAPAPADAPTGRSSVSPKFLESVSRKWTGDLDGMIERRVIRALVVYSKTYYFVDKGAQRGASYDALRLFEDELNKELRKKKILKHKNLRVQMVFIPVPRGDLIPALLEGRGDIAAAGLTVTPEREKLVDFSDPFLAGVDEIVVTGPATPPIATLDELSGREVFVRKSSSYYEHLQGLNAKFAASGKAPVKLKLAPESLEDEDLLEMLNAGLVGLVVVDKPLADFWTKVLPNITARPDLAVNTGGEIAWMFRENSPQLQKAVDEFVKRHGASDPTRAEILRKYLKSMKFVKDATTSEEMRKFQAAVDFFKKYGDQYKIDYLLMMAQGYQESRLDQNVKSRVGAVGVMQVMPKTGEQLKVGDIRQLEPNIRAGVKYIALMRSDYFDDPAIDELNQDLFSFAAYNAGPGRVAGLRKVAAQRGLNPNVWFGNVELIAAEKIGQETVTYVGNIFKYYVAYQLVMETQAARSTAKGAAKPQ
jgi:membrane-bound lytic murein transglycosylase MltF